MCRSTEGVHSLSQNIHFVITFLSECKQVEARMHDRSCIVHLVPWTDALILFGARVVKAVLVCLKF